MSWDEPVLECETASIRQGRVWESLQAVAAPVHLSQAGVTVRDGNSYTRSNVMLLYANNILQRFGTLKVADLPVPFEISIRRSLWLTLRESRNK